MPSKSRTQQRLMGQALAYKRGELKSGDMDPKYADEIKKVAKSMTQKQLKDFAKTKHKGLPEKVEEKVMKFDSFVQEKYIQESGFDFSQTLPITTKNFLTTYYSCDECDGLWKVYNKQELTCKFCESSEIEDMSEKDWTEIVKERMGEEDEDFEEEMRSDSEEVVNLMESNVWEILPEDALKELEMYVDYKNPENEIKVYQDPKVEGTFAVRVYRDGDGEQFDLLWNKGAFDEVEDFETWPPVSGDLKFFY